MSKSHHGEKTADRVRYLRQTSEITQYQFERLAMLPKGYANAIESGDRNPRTDTAIRIARTFGCSLDWLLMGEGTKPKTAAIRAAVARAEKRIETFKQVG